MDGVHCWFSACFNGKVLTFALWKKKKKNSRSHAHYHRWSFLQRGKKKNWKSTSVIYSKTPFQRWRRRRLDLDSPDRLRAHPMQTSDPLFTRFASRAIWMTGRRAKAIIASRDGRRHATSDRGSRSAAIIEAASPSVKLQSGSQRGILIDSLKQTSDASPRNASREVLARTCVDDDVMRRARLTSMGMEKKEGPACKKRGLSRIYESAKKGVNGRERKRIPILPGDRTLFFASFHVSRSECLVSRPHRIRFYPCS